MTYDRLNKARWIQCIVLLVVSTAFAQQSRDTLWVDWEGGICDKSKAFSYKFTSLVQEDIYAYSIYREPDNLLMREGIERKLPNGKYVAIRSIHYDHTGAIMGTYDYDDVGQRIAYHTEDRNTGRKYKMNIKRNAEGHEIQQGEEYSSWFGLEVVYFKSSYNEKTMSVTRKYWGAKDKVITKRNKLKIKVNIISPDGGKNETYKGRNHKVSSFAISPYSGVFVDFDSGTMRKSQLNYYKKGVHTRLDNFYPDGKQIKLTTLYDGNKVKELAYSVNGDLERVFSYEITDRGNTRKNKNGIELRDNTEYHYKDNLKESEVKYVYRIVRDDDRLYYSRYYFNENVSLRPFLKEYYNYKGELLSRVECDLYGHVINGTAYLEDEKEVYKDKKLIALMSYYDDGQVFKDFRNGIAIYYDIYGNEIGKTTYDFEDGEYYGPVNGVEYKCAGNGLESVRRFKNKERVYEGFYTTYRRQVLNGVDFIEEENYYDDDSNIIREVWYNNINGKVLSDVYYDDKQRESLAIFYDIEGAEIGRYDYSTQTGTMYEYMRVYEGHVLTSIEVWDKGELIDRKEFDRE